MTVFTRAFGLCAAVSEIVSARARTRLSGGGTAWNKLSSGPLPAARPPSGRVSMGGLYAV